MNFNNEIFNNLEEAHRRRVEFFTQHHDEDDENLNVNEKIDLFNSQIEKKGEQGLVVLTRFKITKFKHIVEICKESLNCCSKMGRTCKLNITDKMLVTLTYLATGMKYEHMGTLFNIRLPLLQRAIDMTLKSISSALVNEFFKLKVPLNNEKKFKYHPQACGAIDTTLIPISKPHNFEEQKKHYSMKHGQCGIKIQALVRPNGICTTFAFGFPGSVHDMKVLELTNWVNSYLSYNVTLANNANAIHHYPCLFDKGYTGLHNTCHEAIITIRKPKFHDLSQDENDLNNRIESDRIIVENFFGRLKSIFGILATRFRGDKKNHLKYIIPICMSLTNYHISLHPLRVEDDEETEN